MNTKAGPSAPTRELPGQNHHHDSECRGQRPTQQGVDNLVPAIEVLRINVRNGHKPPSFRKAAEVPASRLLTALRLPTMGTETLQHDTAVSIGGRPKFPRLSGRSLTCIQPKSTRGNFRNHSRCCWRGNRPKTAHYLCLPPQSTGISTGQGVR